MSWSGSLSNSRQRVSKIEREVECPRSSTIVKVDFPLNEVKTITNYYLLKFFSNPSLTRFLKLHNVTMIKSRIKVQDDDGNWLVPNEVLLHILKFVPSRFNVSMTCQKLYELTCMIERNDRPLKINTEMVRIV